MDSRSIFLNRKHGRGKRAGGAVEILKCKYFLDILAYGRELSGFYFTGVSTQANLAIGSVQSVAVVVCCAYLKREGVN